MISVQNRCDTSMSRTFRTTWLMPRGVWAAAVEELRASCAMVTSVRSWVIGPASSSAPAPMGPIIAAARSGTDTPPGHLALEVQLAGGRRPAVGHRPEHLELEPVGILGVERQAHAVV